MLPLQEVLPDSASSLVLVSMLLLCAPRALCVSPAIVLLMYYYLIISLFSTLTSMRARMIFALLVIV